MFSSDFQMPVRYFADELPLFEGDAMSVQVYLFDEGNFDAVKNGYTHTLRSD